MDGHTHTERVKVEKRAKDTVYRMSLYPLISVFKLTLSGSIREHTPKLMQPSSALILLIKRDRQTDRENK